MFDAKGMPDFQPPKLYRIGEVMRHTGLSRQTIHNYTVMGLISEIERTEGDQRLYPPEVFGRLRRIIAMKQQGMTLAEIRDELDREATESES